MIDNERDLSDGDLPSDPDAPLWPPALQMSRPDTLPKPDEPVTSPVPFGLWGRPPARARTWPDATAGAAPHTGPAFTRLHLLTPPPPPPPRPANRRRRIRRRHTLLIEIALSGAALSVLAFAVGPHPTEAAPAWVDQATPVIDALANDIIALEVPLSTPQPAIPTPALDALQHDLIRAGTLPNPPVSVEPEWRSALAALTGVGPLLQNQPAASQIGTAQQALDQAGNALVLITHLPEAGGPH